MKLPRFRFLPPPTPAEKDLLQRAAVLLGRFTAVTILFGMIAMHFAQRHQPVIVPKVVGLDKSQAENVLSSKGLHLKFLPVEFDDRIPAGYIRHQNPQPNEYRKRGDTLEVSLSKGSPKVRIPSVIRLSLREAQIQLAAKRLRPGRESYLVSFSEPKDTVLAQTPQADQLVDSFTEVSLLVSAGSPEPSFIMPALKGQPLEQAYKILRPEGITIERITNEVHDDLASETILSQTPAAGSRIQAKDKVSLAISVKSTDASRKSRLATIQFDVPEGNPRRVQIDVLDSSGTRNIYSRMGSPKDHVEVEVNVSGKASAQVYLNQEFVKEIPIE